MPETRKSTEELRGCITATPGQLARLFQRTGERFWVEAFDQARVRGHWGRPVTRKDGTTYRPRLIYVDAARELVAREFEHVGPQPVTLTDAQADGDPARAIDRMKKIRERAKQRTRANA